MVFSRDGVRSFEVYQLIYPQRPLKTHDDYPVKNDFEEIFLYNFLCYH